MTERTIDMTDDENILELCHRISENEEELNNILSIKDSEDDKISVDNLDLQIVEKLEWKPEDEGEFTFEIEGNTYTVNVENIIPDGVVMQYYASNYSEGDLTWVDDNNVQYMSLTGNEKSVKLSDGSDGIKFNGVDTGGIITLPNKLEGDSLLSFSIENVIQIDNDDRARIIRINNSNDDQFMNVSLNQAVSDYPQKGNILFDFRNSSESERVQCSLSETANINDGKRHDISIIINDLSEGDIKFIIDGNEREDVVFRLDAWPEGDRDSVSDPDTWDSDAQIGFEDEIENEVIIGAQIWYNKAIDSQNINNY